MVSIANVNNEVFEAAIRVMSPLNANILICDNKYFE